MRVEGPNARKVTKPDFSEKNHIWPELHQIGHFRAQTRPFYTILKNGSLVFSDFWHEKKGDKARFFRKNHIWPKLPKMGHFADQNRPSYDFLKNSTLFFSDFWHEGRAS